MKNAKCPVCEASLGLYDSIYTLHNTDVIGGCSNCLHPKAALEWFGINAETYYSDVESFVGSEYDPFRSV